MKMYTRKQAMTHRQIRDVSLFVVVVDQGNHTGNAPAAEGIDR